MKTFTYEKAATPEAAVKDIDTIGAKFIAGGTNLLDLMKLQVETPDKLVDISRLDLAKIEEREDGGLTIGALVPNSESSRSTRC
jgi:xanthine dehydrogenase YagS FAD-binding subunit